MHFWLSLVLHAVGGGVAIFLIYNALLFFLGLRKTDTDL